MELLNKLNGSYIRKIEWDSYLNPSVMVEKEEVLYEIRFVEASLFRTTNEIAIYTMKMKYG